MQNVEDLKLVLGTAEETPSQRSHRDNDDDSSTSKKSQSENLFYRDSSTFLKVCRRRRKCEAPFIIIVHFYLTVVFLFL